MTRWRRAVPARAIERHVGVVIAERSVGAGWHQTGGRLVVPDNITLLRLPPHSPEVNPVETVRADLRSNRLSNRAFDSQDAILDAPCDAWNRLIAQPERITTIASRQYAQVNA